MFSFRVLIPFQKNPFDNSVHSIGAFTSFPPFQCRPPRNLEERGQLGLPPDSQTPLEVHADTHIDEDAEAGNQKKEAEITAVQSSPWRRTPLLALAV